MANLGAVYFEKVEAVETSQVVVHPTVLLSVCDHYNRVAKDTKKRVVGTLLGFYDNGKLEVTNSFALPFEEDAQDLDVWFLDHLYLEEMFTMLKKINMKEVIVGWYSTSESIKKNDIQINEILRKYNSSPVYCLINVHDSDQIGIPVTTCKTREEVDVNGNLNRVFCHTPCCIQATPEEEVGVESLLRDIKDASQSQLSKHLSDKTQGLKILGQKLKVMRDYLQKVINGDMPYNQTIINNYQDIFNLLPNLKLEETVRNFSVKNNDYMYVIYVSALIRSILSLHDLINNKIRAKEIEAENIKQEQDRIAEEKKKKLEKEKAQAEKKKKE